MLKALGWLRPSRARGPKPAVPQGLVVYAIGDVHGQADLLAALLDPIIREAAERGHSTALVCLGDYVDRGPASRQVIEALIASKAAPGLEARFLRGNHDQSLLDFLAEPATGPDWCEFGGRETLASYGVTPPRVRDAPEQWEKAREDLAAALPASHLAFLQKSELSLELGDYFFAHAGARPGVPLSDQSDRDLMWIRQPFLGDDRRFEKVVVHGHTPAEAVHADHRRIGLDTGAYATGVLSAVRLEGEDRRLIQAKRQSGGGVQLQAAPLQA